MSTISFNASFSVQQPTAQKICPGLLGRPWEWFPHPCALHRYHMQLADASSAVHVAATSFAVPWASPPPHCLPHHPHTSMCAFPRPWHTSRWVQYRIHFTDACSLTHNPHVVHNPAALMPYVIILFIIIIIIYYYKLYFLCINNIHQRTTSNGWPQPQTQYPACCMPFSNGFIRNNY